MALAAFNPGVLSFERVARLRVIEALERRQPMDEWEVFPIVLGVAFGTVRFIGVARMQAAILRQLPLDFRVAFPALQDCRARPHFVATRALRRTAKRFVGFRKRPRRNLRPTRRDREKEKSHRAGQSLYPQPTHRPSKPAPISTKGFVHHLQLPVHVYRIRSAQNWLPRERTRESCDKKIRRRSFLDVFQLGKLRIACCHPRFNQETARLCSSGNC